MDPSRILISYYSRSGTTRQVARAIREVLGCEIERISEQTSRSGALGYLRSVFDTTFDRPTALRPTEKDPNDYDLVVVGTPIWNGSLSSPMRTYLSMNRRRIRRVALFCTYGGTGSSHALSQVEAFCGQPPIMTLAVRTDDARSNAVKAKVRTFASVLMGKSLPRTSDAPLAQPQAVTRQLRVC